MGLIQVPFDPVLKPAALVIEVVTAALDPAVVDVALGLFVRRRPDFKVVVLVFAELVGSALGNPLLLGGGRLRVHEVVENVEDLAFVLLA